MNKFLLSLLTTTALSAPAFAELLDLEKDE